MKGFDENKYYLGTLCKRGHDYEGTGKSLRTKKKYVCMECTRLYSKKYRNANIELLGEKQRKYQANHRKYCSERRRRYYEEHKEATLKRQRKYYAENRVAKLVDAKQYRQDNREYIYYLKFKWRKKNKKRLNKQEKKERDELCNTYIKLRIYKNHGLEFNSIPSELIELKRTQLRAYRASRDYRKGELSCQKKS